MKALDKFKQQQIFKDSFWALFGSIIGKGFSLLGGILVARMLTKDIYGEYGIIKNTLFYIAVFSTFGLGFTSTRFISKYKKEAKEKVYTIIQLTRLITFVTSLIMALVLLVFAKQVVNFLEAPHLRESLCITSIAIVFNAIDTAQVGILSGMGAFKVNAKNTAISGIINFILSVFFTLKFGLNGSVIALVVAFATSCLLNSISIHNILKNFGRSYVNIKSTIKELLAFSFPIALQESLYSITHWLTVSIFVKFASYGDLALNSAAGQWQAIILFIPGVLRNVTLSHLSGNSNNNLEHNETVNSMLKINFFSTFVPFIFVVLFSRIISSSYGPTFSDLPLILIISVSIAIANCLSNVYSQEFISRGKNWFLFWSRLIKDLAILTIVSGFLYYFEFPGALTMVTVSLIIQTAYLIALHCKYRIDHKKRNI